MKFPEIYLNQVNLSNEVDVKSYLLNGHQHIEGISEDWQDQWELLNPNPHPNPLYSDIKVPILYCGPTKLQPGKIIKC